MGTVMQSRGMSLAEAVVNTALGYVIAILAQLAIFPAFGLDVALGAHLAMGLCFTLVSVLRSYALRRLFNWWAARAAG